VSPPACKKLAPVIEIGLTSLPDLTLPVCRPRKAKRRPDQQAPTPRKHIYKDLNGMIQRLSRIHVARRLML